MNFIYKRIFRFLSVFLVLISLASCGWFFGSNNDSEMDLRIEVNVLDATDGSAIAGANIEAIMIVADGAPDVAMELQSLSHQPVGLMEDGQFEKLAPLVSSSSGSMGMFLHMQGASEEMQQIVKGHTLLQLLASKEGYFASAAIVQLEEQETPNLITANIYLTPNVSSELSADFPVALKTATLAVTNGITNSQLSLTTDVVATSTTRGAILDYATVNLNIPSGTTLLDKDGQAITPIGALTVKIMLFSADPTGVSDISNNPLLAFPGGLSIEGFEGTPPDGLTNNSQFEFISAGLVAIEISDSEGNQVRGFQGMGNVSLTFEVPDSTVNPLTGNPIELSDVSIPMWSFSETTGNWSYEGAASIDAENTNTFTVTKNITHLSYFNLDWFQSQRCKLEVDVVDSNGDANNQQLQVYFSRASGGWAKQKSGWGDPLDKLEIYNVPSFGGTFNLLDNWGDDLLASVEIEGDPDSLYTVAQGETGVSLPNFCGDVADQETYKIRAILNAPNPTLIDVNPDLGLACEIDNSITGTIQDGWYSIRAGKSYIGWGEVTSPLAISGLIDGKTYSIYYYAQSDRASTDFTASSTLSVINLESLSLCPKITQSITTQRVCRDENEAIIKQGGGFSARYGIRDTGYRQSFWGETDVDGNGTITEMVDTVSYEGYAYLHNSDPHYFIYDRFDATSNNPVFVNLTMAADSEFCTSEDPISLTESTLTASKNPAAATTDITLTLQEKSANGDDRLTDTTSEWGLVITSPDNPDVTIQYTDPDENDGRHLATVTSNYVGDVTFQATIGSPAENVGDELTVTFTQAPAPENTSITMVESSPRANGVRFPLTIQAKDINGTNLTTSMGVLRLTATNSALLSTAASGGTPATTITAVDNNNGTYTAYVSNSTAEQINISGVVDPDGENIAVAQALSVTFITPTLVLASTTAELSDVTSNELAAGSVATLTVSLFDQDGVALSGSTEEVKAVLTKTGVQELSTDGMSDSALTADYTLINNNNGTYTLAIKSDTGGDIGFTSITVDSNNVPSSPDDFRFIIASDVTNTTFTANSNQTVTTVIKPTLTLALKDANNALVGYSSATDLAVVFSNKDTPGGIEDTWNSESILDNSDGSYSFRVSCARGDNATGQGPVTITFNYTVDGSSESKNVTTVYCDGG
ncbi:hypothetical protein [Pelagibaculum spongiae]|uniref:Big-1 domain-containing protein n=1 Tax=Pelagibaculum spongiae TaxID=2080658 RepID=A0A2V1GXG2_9GAMM|nr:hypothetical protein [Pelagibaculum spongiae]PVZ66324.1 hypothetical protein DC094_16635 [Pelagibaculum spongiae]